MNPLATPEREKLLRERLAREQRKQRAFMWATLFAVLLWVFLIAVYLITKPF